MEGPNLRRRFNVGLAVVLLAVILVGAFLVTSFDGFGVPRPLLSLQEQARAAIAQVWPFLFVASLGAAVGLAELTSTFDDYPREAIGTRWGQYLIWLNAAAAALAFAVARIYSPDTNLILLILTVGVGFPALIRTKFTLAKEFGGEGGDLSVNFGWLYEQFQKLCKKQIDLELMAYRRTQVDRLLARYPTLQELYDTALYTLRARATLTKEEEAAKLAELEETINQKVPPELTRQNLGLMILELGGVAYVDFLTQAQIRPPEAPGAAPAEATADTVVKQLRELPLTDLTRQALSTLKAKEDQAKINSLAEPLPGIPEPIQKASIARYLVDRIGVDAAQKLASPQA